MPNTSKQEAIRKAWGLHYAEDIDENGWRESNVGSLGWDKECFDIIKKDENVYLIRPKMLNGIVTNNGWIRIESEEQHDEIENDYYWWYNDDNGDWEIGDKSFYGKYTHYQPIVKPEKPIY